MDMHKAMSEMIADTRHSLLLPSKKPVIVPTAARVRDITVMVTPYSPKNVDMAAESAEKIMPKTASIVAIMHTIRFIMGTILFMPKILS